MFKTPVKALSVAVVLAGGSTLPMAVNAQNEQLRLEEVIVTARKREESMQDVPVAVTSLSSELKRSSIRDLRDIQAFVPNIVIDAVGGLQGGAAIAIRGVSYQEIDKSLDPGVGVLLDGVYLGTNAGQILENFDIERLEVLRGPQGTLFGKNTIGGAINIIRSTPTREFGGKVQGTLGEDGRQDIRGLLNLPLTEKGGIKMWASKLESDGYIKNTTYNDDAGGQDYKNGGATVAYEFTDDFDLAFTYERTEDESEAGAWANFNKDTDFACLITSGPGGDGCASGDPGSDEDHNSTNAPNDADTSNDFYNLTLDYELADWALTSITGYINRNENTRLEYDSNRYEFLTAETDTNYEQYSQEFRIHGTIGDVELTGGLYYWYSEYDAGMITLELPASLIGYPAGTTATLSQHGETESYAAFSSADWAVTEKLTLNAGVRYTYEEKKLEPTSQQFFLEDGSLDPDRPGSGATVKVDKDWDKFSPRVGAQYDFTDDIMAYASYSEGFKSGGFFGRITSSANVRGFDPEKVETYEVGVKSDWWNQRLRVNATLFSSEYSDKQEDIIVTNPLNPAEVDTVVLNASDAKMKGAELEVTALLYEGLTFFVQGGYLDAEYDEFLIEGIPGVPTDGSDLDMRNAPEYTFGAGLNYVHSLFGHSEMYYAATYNWRDSYFTIFNNDPLGEVQSAGFWNANVDYRYKDMLTVSVYGRNLGDERYYRAVEIGGVSTFGQYTEPRNYGVTVTYEF
jgi:iron complex outermembrane receptor protein